MMNACSDPQPPRSALPLGSSKNLGGLEEVYHIGIIGKTHGVRGELSVHITDDVFDRVDADYIVLEVDGILVPFFIEEYRFRSDETVIMKLEDVDTQERARELTGCDVYFPRHLADDDAPTLAFLIGFHLVDAATGHRIGTIAAIDDQTANILFELEDGKLIPAAEELITAIDQDSRQITIQLPQGLLDL